MLLLIVGSKIDINLGGLVSFTLQTLFLGLAYYFLPRNWKLAVISVYLILGIAGLPVFNGGSGWSYFTSWPLGFFIGFVCAAFITEPSAHNFYNSLAFFLQVHVVILTIGIIGVGIYTTSFAKALDT
ncbi:MAG: biotin transporter BioY, partial [Bacteroidia bacterium]|nr:biotin transporter BioY [Bacteroidia bacterium]